MAKPKPPQKTAASPSGANSDLRPANTANAADAVRSTQPTLNDKTCRSATSPANNLPRAAAQSARPPRTAATTADHTALLDALATVPRSSLVALSGGCDSLSLLHACHRAGLAPIAAHYNHRWQPAEDDWAEHLSNWCRRRGIPFHSAASAAPRPGNETAARDERYRWLLELAQKLGSPALLTAHHADDQAETLLMRLLRGTGPAGLGGIPPRSERDGVLLLRPWLHIARRQIVSYAKAHRLRFIDDPFNHPARSLRGAIRARLLPLMRELAARDIIPQLARLARHCADDNALLEELAATALRECRDRSRPDRLHARRLATLAPALRRRVLAAWLVQDYPGHHISEELLDGILALATSTRPPARLNLPGGGRLCRRQARLLIELSGQ
jgi:tRNA(Ile)-lysidine synthase